MHSDSLLGLTSISQWALFVGISFIVFGWIEKRENFVLGGQIVFLLLGFIAIYILVDHEPFLYRTNLKELRVIAFFKGVALFTGFNVLSLILNQFKFRFMKISVYVLVFFALILFFMVFSIQQMP